MATPTTGPLLPNGAGDSLPYDQRAAAHIEKASSLLEDGAYDEALHKALRGLAMNPYQLDGYRMMIELAEYDENEAARLKWTKWLYWAAFYGGDEGTAESAAASLAELYPGWNTDGELLEEWRFHTEKAIDSASGGSKQYLLAGHLMNKLLELNPTDKDLLKRFDKLFDKAGEALSGGGFTAAKVRRRSAKWLDEINAKHSDWKKPFKRTTKHYKIITNISYEFFETISVVMEDMFRFYRSVYGYEGGAPKVTLAVHRRRSDFDRYCQKELGRSLSLGVGGWFLDKTMTVAAYDRTETGTNLRQLWGTLFHEASHQFMYLMTEKRTKQDPPTWLNEGTASYFEGCEIKADGSIVKNKPALSRLRSWERLERSEDPISLERLVTVPHRDYSGRYYPYGWSLVYFLNNYENADGELVYRDAYLKYLQSFTRKSKDYKKDPGGEALRRAKQMFVEEIADPDVPEWEQFEDRWRTYIRKIAAESRKGADFADELQKRARRYLDRGDFERAQIAAEQADDKRANDGETFRILALANHGLDRDAEAVYWMFRHWENAWADGESELADAASEWLRQNKGKDIVKNYIEPTQATLEKFEKAMDQAVEDGHPVAAMLFASHALKAFSVEHDGLAARIDALREESEEDLRLWLRAFTRDGRSNWKLDGEDVVRYDDDGVLVYSPEDYARWSGRSLSAYATAPQLRYLEPPFEMKGNARVDGKSGGYIGFGVGPSGQAQVSLSFYANNTLDLDNIDVGFPEDDNASDIIVYMITPVGHLDLDAAQTHYFELDVHEDGGEIRVGKKKKTSLPKSWGVDRLTGRFEVGAGRDTAALFGDIEVRVNKPFWPVSPSGN